MQNIKNLLVMDKTVVAVRRKIILCYRKKKNSFKLWTQLMQMWLLLQITKKSVKF